jgi:peptidoglycan/LPS O-acetylase OafA/YrhL
MESRPSSARPEAPARQLQSLTSLRGLAALWVVLYHYSTVYFPRLDIGDYSNLIAKGYLAVDLFFMLSGFVMTHVYYRAFSESITQNYRNFLVARIARLYPLHLLVLFLFLATALTSQLLLYMRTGLFHGIPLEGARSMGAFAANLFMLQGLAAGELSWNYPAWSISIEFLLSESPASAIPTLAWIVLPTQVIRTNLAGSAGAGQDRPFKGLRATLGPLRGILGVHDFTEGPQQS